MDDHVNEKPFCFVASPFAARTPEETERNLEFARAICRRISLETSLEPRAPHLYFPQFLHEAEKSERELGIAYGKNSLRFSSFALFAVPPWREDLSTGMRFELEEVIAQRVGYNIAWDADELDGIIYRLSLQFPRVK
jgi:hypothetical protein